MKSFYNSKWLCAIVILLSIPTICFSQKNDVDSISISISMEKPIEQMTLVELKKKINELDSIGQYQEMLPFLLTYHNMTKEQLGHHSKEHAQSTADLAYCYRITGNYDLADSTYQNSLILQNELYGENSSQYIYELSEYGAFLREMEKFDKAEELLLEAMERGKKHKDKFENKVEYVSLYSALGNFYRYQHQYEKALPIYLKAVELFKKEIGEQDIEYGSMLTNLAQNYSHIGQKEKSLKLQKEAVAVTEKYHGTDSWVYGQRVNNLALAYPKTLENKKTIDSLYQISLKNAAKLSGTDNPEYAIRLANLGSFYFTSHEFEKAIPILKESRNIFNKHFGKSHRNSLVLSGYYSKALWHNGEKEESVNTLLEALDYKGGHHKFTKTQMAILVYSEYMFEEMGYDTLLQDLYLQRNKRNEDILNNKFVHFSENEQISFGNELKADFNEIESYTLRNIDNEQFLKACFNNQLALKGLLLRNNNTLKNAMQNADELTKSNYKKWVDLKNKLSVEYGLPLEQRSVDMEELEIQANELESNLARQSLPFRNVHLPASWEQVRDALKEGEVAIEFSKFNYHTINGARPVDSIMYVAYLIKKNDVSPKVVYLFEENEIGNLRRTRSLYNWIKRGDNKNLHELIWAPLAIELEDISTIYYSPAGLLHRINFSSIPINEKESIGERFQLHNFGSTRQLVFPNNNASDNLTDALVFGGIQYDTDKKILNNYLDINQENELASRNLGEAYRSYRGNDWSYLEWTEKEADDIQQLLKQSGANVTLKKGLAANEETVKQIGKSGDSPQILHFATHGYFFPEVDTAAATGFQAAEHPLIRSGIVMAGANAAWSGEAITGIEDGILTAYEIAQLNLKNTDLVVLSACDTGLGEIEGDEGVYGLQRAFKMAGAKYVLMSLWKVSDRHGYDFMTTFYKEWLEEGLDIPTAFQSAQNKMKEKYAKPFNPSLWAGFVLVE